MSAGFFLRFWRKKVCFPESLMSRPIHARISLAALRHNYRQVKARCGAAKAFAVVKANAYGHGLAQAIAALKDLADGFAVLELSEAITLREGGCEQPILLLEGFFSPQDLPTLAHYRLTPAVHRFDQLASIREARLVQPLPVFLKLNCGMNRLGFAPNDWDAACREVADTAVFGQSALMAHFAEADGGRGVDWQLERLAPLLARWQGPVTLANSAAIISYPACHRDWVRPGIMLYGASPFADVSAAELGLRPVMTLMSEVIGVQELQPGDRVGYGGTFEAERPMRIGIVACGYADGYPRHAPGGNERSTPLLVNGQRSRLVGRVSMDMLVCDLSGQPDAGVGSAVTLWGEGMPADEVATAAGTISYELFTALARRVPLRISE